MAAAPKMNVPDAATEEHPAINSILGRIRSSISSPSSYRHARRVGALPHSRPDSVLSRVGQLAIDLVQIGLGNSEIAPSASDKRFGDPAFAKNPIYKRVMQSYLAWRSSLLDLVAGGSEHRLERCRATSLRYYADYRSARRRPTR